MNDERGDIQMAYMKMEILPRPSMEKISINIEEIPLHVRDQLARSLLRAAETFFSDPDNKKAYEDWLRKRRETA